jgi:hypothetical protein
MSAQQKKHPFFSTQDDEIVVGLASSPLAEKASH